jgi:hypothetical protein
MRPLKNIQEKPMIKMSVEFRDLRTVKELWEEGRIELSMPDYSSYEVTSFGVSVSGGNGYQPMITTDSVSLFLEKEGEKRGKSILLAEDEFHRVVVIQDDQKVGTLAELYTQLSDEDLDFMIKG